MDLFSGIEAAKGAVDVGGRLLEIYKIKTDGSFYQQKEFESRLREREVAVAAERRAASTAASDWRGLEIALASLSQTDRLNRFLSANPFRLSVEDTKELVREVSSEGSRPVLLEAPISVDKRAPGFEGQETLDLNIGQLWSRHPCADDIIPLGGVIDRPLKHQDLDVHMIANFLSDIPVVLVYGCVKADSTLWLSVYAWNIVGREPTREPLKVAFPSVACPPMNNVSPEVRAWKDELGSRITTIVALLAQWFFLVQHGRKPTLDKLATLDSGDEIRALLARQLVAAYEILASEGNSSTDLRLDQAELFADAGMNAQASVFALSILDQVREQKPQDTDYLALQRLTDLLHLIGDDASASQAEELLESHSKIAVQRILGWIS